MALQGDPEDWGGVSSRVWPFEGREPELAELRSAFLGSGMDAVLITAPPGVGKTRLAAEAMPTMGAAHTVWVPATRAAAGIPFGAVAPLLPDAATATTAWQLMLATAAQAREWGGRRRVAIAVDDAHLLDDASATLIAHLVDQGLAFAIMTARSGQPVADALLLPVKDGRGLHIKLSTLPRTVIDKLIEHAGAGHLDAASRRRLHQLTQGNPLALRELLHGAQPGGLAELMASRMAALSAGVRRVVELVACGEPVAVPALERLVSLDVLVSAEDTGLVVVERSGQRRVARLDHPLYGETVRAKMTVSQSMRTYRDLAQALLATPLRRREDALLAAHWQVEAGSITRPDIVRAGAWKAVGHADLQLAEHLARAARDVDPVAEADRLLAEILAYRGRTDEARQVISATPPSTADELVGWAVTRADTLYWHNGDLDSALSILDLAGGHAVTRASRSWLLFFDGRCREAADTADGVLADPGAEPKALIWAAAAGGAAHGFLGSLDRATDIHTQGAAVAAAYAAAMPWGVVEVDTGACLAHLACGKPEAAQAIATAGHESAMATGAAMMVYGWALYGGLAALARGHLDAADQLLAEAQSGFEVNDTFRLSRCCLAARSATVALRGDGDPRPLMAQADAVADPVNGIFAPWMETWRAWFLYAVGDLAGAAAAVTRAADIARDAAMPVVEALALYDLARLGARADLSRLDSVEHELAALLARVARALAGRDGAADLEGTARALHAHGYDLLAAEAYNVAAHRHERQHRRTQADLVRAGIAQLGIPVPQARTPLLQHNHLTSTLTQRERQLVLLAADHTSAEIADRLRLTVATVNNNLSRAYSKLGITGRAQLRELINRQHVEP